ncbi:MAG TPA: hypothetical protein VKV34_12800 [Thermoleophilia bacterium]|nr:hypothetical protein [Thermoleophilia bacterium]
MGAAHRVAIAAGVAVFAGVVLIPWYSRPGDDVYGWNVNALGQAISLATFWLALAAGMMLLGCRRLGRTPLELHVLRAGALVAGLCLAELALHRHAGFGLYLAGGAGVVASLAGRRAASSLRPRRRRAAAQAGLTRS